MPDRSDPAAPTVRTAGAAVHPAILLLHGLGSRSGTWSAQVPALDADWYVIAPDLPGHGGAAAASAPGAYTPEALATAVLAILDAWGIERAHVVGHAFGGVVAMAIALLAPERLAALVLEDSSPEGLPAAVRGRLRHTLAEAAGAGVGSEPAPWPPAAGNAPGRGIPGAAVLSAIEFRGYVERLEEITAPTLVVVGESDTAFNQRGAELLHGLIPFSRLVGAILGRR